MTPVLSAEQVAETVSKFRAFVTDKGGKIVHEDAWGLQVAYPIQKKSTGFYHLMEFEADPSVILPFETEFRQDGRIFLLSPKGQASLPRAVATSRTAKQCRSRRHR